ncbi:MAG: 3-dehydroquinate synthase, partial [Oscillospiraceae bacterium]|nr:3-dehydroquinate synthase [Oscillospiraceae bacterium]
MISIEVNAPSKKYKVYIGAGLLDRAGEMAAELIPAGTAAIVSDSNVAPLYMQRLAQSLDKFGFKTLTHVIPAGEESKNPAELLKLLDHMADGGLYRKDA